MNMGKRITGKAVRNHISSRMAKELIAIYRTVYHLWFLVFLRVLAQLRLHLPRHPSSSQESTSENKDSVSKKRCCSSSIRQTRCMIPPKTKKKKMVNQKKYKEINRMSCLIRYRNSGRIWLMKVLQQSLGETPEQGSQDTSKSSHELPMEPRAKWNRVRVSTVYFTHFPKDPNCDICLKTKITRASCRRQRTGTVG